MDPQDCLYQMLEYIQDGDRDGTEQALFHLYEWVQNGGYLPKVEKYKSIPYWYIPHNHFDN